jgi:hypothetical protein
VVRRCCAYGLSVLVLLALDSTSAPADGVAGDDGGSEKGKAVVQKLLDGGKLELSTRPTSGAERFHFFCMTKITGKDGALETRSYYVVRDGKRVAMLTWPGDGDDNGHPCWYSTDGLVVALDPDVPGGLILDATGAPVVLVTDDGERPVVKFEHRAGEKAGRVVLDVAPILKQFASDARRYSYDEKESAVTIDVGQADLRVRVSPDVAERSVVDFDELVFGNKYVSLWVKVPTTAAPKRDYFSVTAESVRKLGLPVRTPGKEFDASRLQIPLADLRRDPKLREASEKLQSLFPLRATPK